MRRDSWSTLAAYQRAMRHLHHQPAHVHQPYRAREHSDAGRGESTAHHEAGRETIAALAASLDAGWRWGLMTSELVRLRRLGRLGRLACMRSTTRPSPPSPLPPLHAQRE